MPFEGLKPRLGTCGRGGYSKLARVAVHGWVLVDEGALQNKHWPGPNTRQGDLGRTSATCPEQMRRAAHNCTRDVRGSIWCG